ncbi:MAG: carbohydrate-binding protein [Bacteroidaceae bacterium]|nr:carbohydrate-binding protein [Bacteroidaceae bacterium]
MKPLRLLSAILSLFVAVCAYALEDGQTVRLINSSKSAFVLNSSLDENKPVVIWKETNVNAQRWTIEAKTNGTFLLNNDYTGFYLSATSTNAASKVIQSKKSTANSKGSWELVPVEGSTEKYYIYLGTSRKFALAVPASPADGDTLAVVNTLDENNPVAPARITWTVRVVNQMEKAFTKDKRDNMMSKWKSRAYKSANVGHVIGNGGWWGDAEMFEVVLDALETTGDQQYATMFDELYQNFLSRNHSIWYQRGVQGYNEYNDDIAWMCIACVRGYLLTGKEEYLTTSKTNFDGMFARADCYGNDLLQWKHNSGQGTNSCINGPAAVCACYLAIAEADESYYEKARKTYMAERGKLFEMSNGKPTGAVWDSYDQGSGNYNKWCSTYNQGTNLGAAIMLYNHYGEQMFKDDADAIISWSESHLANSHGIINACQTVSGDLCGFKGIMLRYIRMYAESFNVPSHYDWIAKNAYHAWNNRNSAGITSSAWLTKSEEDFKHQEGEELKNFANEGNMTCVSAAFNCHLGAVDYHDAYAQNEAEDFNFVRNAPVNYNNNGDEDAGGRVGPMTNGHYIGYRRVDFGSKIASHINLRVKISLSSMSVDVYLDQPNDSEGTLLCNISKDDIPSLLTWETVQKAINVPVTGVHNLYFVARTNGNSGNINLNWWQFESKNTVYADLTNGGGTFTTSLNTDNLTNIADDDLLSTVNAGIEERENSWILYQSPSPMTIYGYQLFSGNDRDCDPKGWQLQGSNDGQNWETLHTVSDASFSVQAERYGAELETTKAYTHYRLLFDFDDNQQGLSISEWQLLGRCIDDVDITADGGTISEGQESLIDHVGTTVFTTPITTVYHPAGNYKLTAYSITADSASTAPVSWRLEGSANGVSAWTIIDQQKDAVFPYDYSTNVYRVNPENSYLHYRLVVTGEEAKFTQLQLFGKLDFGQYYAEATTIATVVSSDGSDALPLIDKDGTTYATINGNEQYFNIATPIPTRVIGFSLVSADDAELDPKDITLFGCDESGTETQISSKVPSFSARGARITYSVSTTKTFKRFKVLFNQSEASSVRLADFELYGTAIADKNDENLVEASSVEASAPSLSTSEAIKYINDGSRTTYYRSAFTEPVSITYTMEDSVCINAYSISASKNEVTRDPSDWILEGSNDGQNWTLLDARSGEFFSHRYATQFYYTESNAAFSNYRLTITAVNGAKQMQIGEFQLLNIQPVDPDGVETVANNAETPQYIYNLAGQRLSKVQRGINIVGGKKILVK